jgi:malonate transporter and related proteins
MSNSVQFHVWQALAPVFVLIAAGALAAHMRWVTKATIGELSNLVFFVFMPGLLFRTMSKSQWETLDFSPTVIYLGVVLSVFAGLWWWRGRTVSAATMGLGSVFSNLVMIGVPLVTVSYGPQGLVTLLTLVSVHAMLLLTVGTMALEWARAREQRGDGGTPSGLARQLWSAVRGAIIHPVPIPILAGLAYSATGWELSGVADKSLQWLGAAAGPLALVMLGASTYLRPIGGRWRGAVGVVAVKLLALPVLVLAGAWLGGLRGLPLTVLVVAASLPMGANVFLFSQRYQACEDEVSAASSLSTLAAALTVSAWMVLMGWVSHAS